jgi:hypothetical protein
MFSRFMSFGCAIVALISCTSENNRLDRELHAILGALPGTYAGQAPLGLALNGELQNIFHKIARIDAPQFGDEVLFYQLSRDAPDGPPLQMKIFVFDTSKDREMNRMSSFIFISDQLQGNLEKHPEKWTELDPTSLMSFPESCAFNWEGVDNGFEGHVSAADCLYSSRAFQQDIRPQMTYRIVHERFEWDESLYTEEMKVIVSTGGVLTAYRQ